jgi:hypothetical protein
MEWVKYGRIQQGRASRSSWEMYIFCFHYIKFHDNPNMFEFFYLHACLVLMTITHCLAWKQFWGNGICSSKRHFAAWALVDFLIHNAFLLWEGSFARVGLHSSTEINKAVILLLFYVTLTHDISMFLLGGILWGLLLPFARTSPSVSFQQLSLTFLFS